MKGLRIETITVGPFAANCYLAAAPESDSILVVDPGAEAERLAEAVRAYRLPVAAYLLTHGHADHISALPELLQRYPAPVYIHGRDASWAFTPANRIDPWYAPVRLDTAGIRKLGAEPLTEEWRFVEVLPTPGHSPGSVCFLAAGVLFSGDTLFAGSVGRTDLPGGDSRQLAESLRRLASLDPATRVLPGHGPATTIGDELRDGYLGMVCGTAVNP